jgi:hypothetical protein
MGENEQIRQTRSLMGLAGQHGEERLNRLYEELDLGVQGLNDGLTIDDIAGLERECGVLLSYLLEAAIRRQDRLANRPRADDEARLHRIDEQLGGLINPQGLADRLRQRIRRLQEENRQQEATLHQQGEDIRDLRATLAELRRDMERGMQQAPVPVPEPRRSEPRERPPVDPRALLKIEPPPKFSGTDRSMPFRRWWRQVEEFLDGQPEEVIGGERRRILWVSRQLEKEALEWYQDWVDRVDRGLAEHRWTNFVDELRTRFTDDNEADSAYRELEAFTYREDIHTFLIRWDVLCRRAGVSGVAYRKMLFAAIGQTLRNRLELKILRI